MANLIELATIFQQELDKKLVEDAVTGWMELNADETLYSGGAEVKIPKIDMDGLGDYDRNLGYPEGSVSLAYQTMTMTQDRGRGFNLDAMDVTESNLAASAGNVMGEFQRTKVVPEIDLYRLNKIFLKAGDRKRTYTPAANSVWGALQDDIAAVQEKVGTGVALVVHIAGLVHTLLSRSTEYARNVSIMDFQHGIITTKVKAIDGVALIPTRSALMQTAIKKQDGRAEEEKAGGYKIEAASKGINWLVMARSAPIAVSKTDKIRIFDPNTFQNLNAWHIDYRKYHDLWVTDNQLDGVYANVGA